MTDNIIETETLEALAGSGITEVCIALGIFDGVHAGHRHLLKRLTDMSSEMGCTPVVVTFSPHPKVIVDPEHAPVMLLSPSEKAHRLAECGVKAVVTIPFTRELSSMTAEEFLDSVIMTGRTKVKGLCVGRRFHCGRGGKGTVDILSRYAGEHGITFAWEEEYCIEGETVSSSAIRTAAGQGDLDKVLRFLGKPLTLCGKVESGFGIAGTKLEHPTANVITEYGVLPPCGVYAAYTKADNAWHETALQIGKAPTFLENGTVRVEAHLLDYTGNLYGKEITIRIMEKIRDEQKFSSAEALTEQIIKDVKAIRNILKGKEIGNE